MKTKKVTHVTALLFFLLSLDFLILPLPPISVITVNFVVQPETAEVSHVTVSASASRLLLLTLLLNVITPSSLACPSSTSSNPKRPMNHM